MKDSDICSCSDDADRECPVHATIDPMPVIRAALENEAKALGLGVEGFTNDQLRTAIYGERAEQNTKNFGKPYGVEPGRFNPHLGDMFMSGPANWVIETVKEHEALRAEAEMLGLGADGFSIMELRIAIRSRKACRYKEVQAKDAARALLVCDPELGERCKDGIDGLEPADLEAIAERLLKLLDDKA